MEGADESTELCLIDLATFSFFLVKPFPFFFYESEWSFRRFSFGPSIHLFTLSLSGGLYQSISFSSKKVLVSSVTLPQKAGQLMPKTRF